MSLSYVRGTQTPPAGAQPRASGPVRRIQGSRALAIALLREARGDGWIESLKAREADPANFIVESFGSCARTTSSIVPPAFRCVPRKIGPGLAPRARSVQDLHPAHDPRWRCTG